MSICRPAPNPVFSSVFTELSVAYPAFSDLLHNVKCDFYQCQHMKDKLYQIYDKAIQPYQEINKMKKRPGNITERKLVAVVFLC